MNDDEQEEVVDPLEELMFDRFGEIASGGFVRPEMNRKFAREAARIAKVVLRRSRGRRMIIFALSGKAQSGKDTAGQILVEDHGFSRYAFADALKACALALDPFVDLNWGQEVELMSSLLSRVRLSKVVEREGWEKAKFYPDVRRLLQRMGTEVGREILGSTIWVDIVTQKLSEELPERAVVTDCRFENEVNGLKAFANSMGGRKVRVVSMRMERDAAPMASSVSGHRSEELDFPVDVIMRNEGPLEDLRRELGKVFVAYQGIDLYA